MPTPWFTVVVVRTIALVVAIERLARSLRRSLRSQQCGHGPVVVLVGTERHLHAEDIAAATVYAARHEGLATVAALFLAGIVGFAQKIVDVAVSTGSIVDVTVEVVTLGVEVCQQGCPRVHSCS